MTERARRIINFVAYIVSGLCFLGALLSIFWHK